MPSFESAAHASEILPHRVTAVEVGTQSVDVANVDGFTTPIKQAVALPTTQSVRTCAFRVTGSSIEVASGSL
ncbi:MAG: hypothetical protein IT305_16200 [Chloroflexi bacterium]|nr:hypothetical protein [Chloroflexota bacterium]